MLSSSLYCRATKLKLVFRVTVHRSCILFSFLIELQQEILLKNGWLIFFCDRVLMSQYIQIIERTFQSKISRVAKREIHSG